MNDRSSSRSRSGSRANTNRDRIRYYICRGYDHFTKDCPILHLEKESEQIHTPLDGGKVTDRCLGGLAVRELMQNVRGIRFNSHSRLNFSVSLRDVPNNIKLLLDKLCLTDVEKKQVMDILYKYKDAFSLRDEMGTCPNIEVEINVTDKCPFSIRLYHVKEEDKKTLEKEMNRLCNLGILKESFWLILVQCCVTQISYKRIIGISV